MSNKEIIINADTALTPSGWSDNVFVKIDKEGKISEVSKTQPKALKTPLIKVDVLLPAITNLHSHSFQRAMAGLTEKRGRQSFDSFWTWRELMYKFLKILTPEDIFSITAFGQMEMLKSGYACVTEFHYLHHQPDGSPYENIAATSHKIIEASEWSGIGLCLLPVLYEQGGCDGKALEGGQLRFGNKLDSFSKLVNETKRIIDKRSDFHLGLAAHSLRAVSIDSLNQFTKIHEGPFHMHVAEQDAEVEEILQNYGQRPVEWVLNNIDLDHQWCLIHCTQMTKKEANMLAKSNATVGLCPITEANLGDGVFNGKEYIQYDGNFGIGTDSNIKIELSEEMRMLEYSQRLSQKQRVLLANNKHSNGRFLFEKVVKGGSMASRRKSGKIESGYLADLISLDMEDVYLKGTRNDLILDSWIFSAKNNVIKNLWSAGRHLISDGQYIKEKEIISLYKNTMKNLNEKISL